MATAEVRTPALRKPKAATEIEHLGRFERALLRLFEFLASVKLAIFLMAWLIVELTVGTFVESQVNTAAAGYFVYKTFHFRLLLALLATCVLCAALIRYPWKRYQTGFLVTHLGLLVILAGSMITTLTGVDALMPVEQGKSEQRIYDPAYECLFISSADMGGPRGKATELQLPVNFGPFTWGHKVFGSIPWRKDYTETHKLDNGDTIRVLKFYANCDPETVYVPTDLGPPALKYRLTNPNRGIDFGGWVAADPESMTGAEKMPMGQILIWRVADNVELAHFIDGTPQKDASGLLGTLSYSHAGKHHFLSVAELKQKPAVVKEANTTIRLIDYLPNAKLDRDANNWRNQGDEPINPLLRLGVRVGAGEEREFLAFGRHREYDTLLTKRQGAEHLFSYFPADPDASIEIAVTPQGNSGYRAFGSNGLVAVSRIELGKDYAAWAGMKFSPQKILGAAKSETVLRGKNPQRGQPGRPGIIVEYESGGKSTRFPLVRDASTTGRVGNRLVALRYGIREADLPFAIRLDDFDEPKNPGTNQAAMYTSRVTLIDKEQNVEKSHEITMNYPLYYKDKAGNRFTFYQSGIDRSTGKVVSTYTVARDPGLNVKYAGSCLLILGTFLMFYMGGYFKRSE